MRQLRESWRMEWDGGGGGGGGSGGSCLRECKSEVIYIHTPTSKRRRPIRSSP